MDKFKMERKTTEEIFFEFDHKEEHNKYNSRKWVAVDDLKNIKLLLQDVITDYELWVGQCRYKNNAWSRRKEELEQFVNQLENANNGRI